MTNFPVLWVPFIFVEAWIREKVRHTPQHGDDIVEQIGIVRIASMPLLRTASFQMRTAFFVRLDWHHVSSTFLKPVPREFRMSFSVQASSDRQKK